MFSRRCDPARVRRILFISLSNIGDVVLTFPAFDALAAACPDAVLTVVTSPKAKGFFCSNPRVEQVHTFEKQAGLREKTRWLLALRRNRFDLIVDLRNSLLPYLVRGRHRTLPPVGPPSGLHMRDKHLCRVRSVLRDMPRYPPRRALVWSVGETTETDTLLQGRCGFLLAAPGAADERKRWPEKHWTETLNALQRRHGLPVVLVGDRSDAKGTRLLTSSATTPFLDLCGMTSLKTLARIVSRARLFLGNDSGIAHLASYLDIPSVVLFGPTNPVHYGPWGRRGSKIQSPSGLMNDITPASVIDAAGALLNAAP